MTICIDRSTELIRAVERVVSKGVSRELGTPFFVSQRDSCLEAPRRAVILIFWISEYL